MHAAVLCIVYIMILCMSALEGHYCASTLYCVCVAYMHCSSFSMVGLQYPALQQLDLALVPTQNAAISELREGVKDQISEVVCRSLLFEHSALSLSGLCRLIGLFCTPSLMTQASLSNRKNMQRLLQSKLAISERRVFKLKAAESIFWWFCFALARENHIGTNQHN